MGVRYAVIIGTTKGTNSFQKELDSDVCKESVGLISETFTALGADYSFELVGKRGYFINPKLSTVRNAIEGLKPKPDDVLLIYYYGHAGIFLANICTLGFAEISSQEHPSNAAYKMYSLERLVETGNATGFKKIIVILDACFSGVGGLSLDEVGALWAIFSSTGDTVQLEDVESNPFTREIANVLKNPELREQAAAPGAQTLTLRDLWRVVKNAVRGINGLAPEIIGPLSDFDLAPVIVQVPIALNEGAPSKSLYKKLFRLARILSQARNKNVGVAFASIKESLRNEPSFKVIDATGKKVLIKDGTLRDYLRIGVLLKIWEATGEDSWRLVSDRVIDASGSRFNGYVVSGVLHYLPPGVDTAEVRRCVRGIIRADFEPTYFRIIRQLQDDFGPWNPDLKPSDRRVMIRLLGYSLVLRRASADTYFPR